MKNLISKLLVFFITICISTYLHVQQKKIYDYWLDNYEQGVNSFNKRLFNEAIPFFENPKTTNTSIDKTNTNVFKTSENPLLSSDLPLANANYAWQNGNNPYERNDSIIKALEISDLYLSKTDLVVLSSCDSRLGDIDSNESIYGLQRAFKMAGVNLIMMSLWEVSNKETAEFMELFYSNWLSGQNVRNTFKKIQLDMFNT